MSCQDDEMCKNIDKENSTPGNTIYKCPSSTCNGGVCSCDSNCQLDEFYGVCVNNNPTQTPYPTPYPTQTPGPTQPNGGPSEGYCQDDDMCKNVDQENMAPGDPIKYECPNSSCNKNNGLCSCDIKCVYSSRTGICVREDTPNIPIKVPLLNKCEKIKISENEFVCWKRVEENDNIYIKNCDSVECGINKSNSKYTKKYVAGTYSDVYKTEVALGDDNDKPLPIPILVLLVFIPLLLFFMLFLISQ
jgi:hypothetical protein